MREKYGRQQSVVVTRSQEEKVIDGFLDRILGEPESPIDLVEERARAVGAGAGEELVDGVVVMLSEIWARLPQSK